MYFLKRTYSALTPPERKMFFVAGAVIALSIILILAIVIVKNTISVPAAGGAFTEGMVGQPANINPVTAVNDTDLSLAKLIYSNLPDLADKIQTSPDGKTWTVRLKNNLRWQDGQKLTSDDIIFTVQSIDDPTANSPLATTWHGVTASRVSELELTFALATPYAFFDTTLKNLYVVPKHLFADTPPANWHLSNYNLKPVGSGPYKFASYDQKNDGFITGYHLSAWGAYWGTKPLIQNLDVAFFPNEDDLIKSFNNAQIDGLTTDADDLTDIKRPYDLYSWPTSNEYAVFWNQGDNSAVADPAVRAALAEAVDRNELTADALKGNGEVSGGPIPPGAPSAISISTATSLDNASTTLTNAGWILGGSGTRVKSTGKSSTTLAFTLTVPDIDFLVQTANQLQAVWQSLGANVTVATDTPQNIAANQVVNRNYDALLYGETLGPDSDLYAFWNSANRFAPGENLALYNNAHDDALMNSIRTTLSEASRTAMFAELQNDIASANAAVFLYSPDDIYITNKSVRGINPTFLSDPSDRFLQIPSWYLNTARVLK
jgi:peptide/nickel transport system substrate-binding protein